MILEPDVAEEEGGNWGKVRREVVDASASHAGWRARSSATSAIAGPHACTQVHVLQSLVCGRTGGALEPFKPGLSCPPRSYQRGRSFSTSPAALFSCTGRIADFVVIPFDVGHFAVSNKIPKSFKYLQPRLHSRKTPACRLMQGLH